MDPRVIDKLGGDKLEDELYKMLEGKTIKSVTASADRLPKGKLTYIGIEFNHGLVIELSPEYDQNMKKAIISIIAWPIDDLDKLLEGTELDILGLSIRAYNCLKRNSIHTIEQVHSMTNAELLTIPNLGIKSLEDIRLKLENYLLNNK